MDMLLITRKQAIQWLLCGAVTDVCINLLIYKIPLSPKEVKIPPSSRWKQFASIALYCIGEARGTRLGHQAPTLSMGLEKNTTV